MSEIVFLDRPGWRVTSRMIEVVGRRVPTAHVYTASVRRAGEGWWRRAWERAARRAATYELRMLTAAGRMVVEAGADRAAAEELAAAINRAVRPSGWVAG